MNEEQIRRIVESVVDRLLAQGDSSESRAAAGGSGKSVALGADHGGFELKEHLKGFLSGLGYRVLDRGTHSKDSVDYPDFAVAVARAVSAGEADAGIMLDGAGIGSSMAANKVKGVRAALCYNEKTIINSRSHNNANMLTLGAPFHSPAEAEKLTRLWLETEFEGGRHAKRVDKIDALDCGCNG